MLHMIFQSFASQFFESKLKFKNKRKIAQPSFRYQPRFRQRMLISLKNTPSITLY